MSRFFWWSLLLFLSSMLAIGVWQYLHHPHPAAQSELSQEPVVPVETNSDDKLLAQVNDELEAIADHDYERLILQIIPQLGLSGAALDERLEYERMWLEQSKLFVRFHLGLEVRYYLDYLVLKYRVLQQMVRERENLRKRYGDSKDFLKNWELSLIEILKPYYLNLEELFENNYNEMVKFNQLFNEKLMISRKKRFQDNPVQIGL